MVGKLRAVVAALAIASAPALAQVDSSLQTLLNALMQGSEVALLTQLADGTVQVTSFRAPGQRSATDAAALIERARVNLANLGVAAPTGEQLAVALAGGPIEIPSGRTSMIGVLPAGTNGVEVRTQVVSQAGLPSIVAVSPAGVGAASAASGGTAPGGAAALNGPLAPMSLAQQTQATELARAQLAAMGITQPTPTQVQTMLQGGTLLTPDGVSVTVPGLVSGRPAQAPVVSSPWSPPATMAAPQTPSTTSTLTR